MKCLTSGSSWTKPCTASGMSTRQREKHFTGIICTGNHAQTTELSGLIGSKMHSIHMGRNTSILSGYRQQRSTRWYLSIWNGSSNGTVRRTQKTNRHRRAAGRPQAKPRTTRPSPPTPAKRGAAQKPGRTIRTAPQRYLTSTITPALRRQRTTRPRARA